MGRLLWIPGIGTGPVQVVGVVGHVRKWGLAKDDLSPVQDQVYYPLTQLPDKLIPIFSTFISIVIRTDVSPLSTLEALRQQVRGVAGDQTLYDVSTLEQLASASLAEQRFLLLLFGIFSGLALLLACVGIYGVLAYLLSQRVPEFGVRLAMGATSSDIVRLVLRESLAIILSGMAIGMATSWGGERVLRDLVPAVQTSHLLILVVILPVMIAVSLLASYIPARRAAKVDPMVALRYE